ncbi:MAG: hypothetical protein ABN482_00070 [Corticimicrobacter sp.]|uniref:hypothetical protein n=1 Tax=Corticimicrobacter sp. TaxID=2678536 RepID=UPI0032DB9280
MPTLRTPYQRRILQNRFAGRGRFTFGVVLHTRFRLLSLQELAFRSLVARAKPG